MQPITGSILWLGHFDARRPDWHLPTSKTVSLHRCYYHHPLLTITPAVTTQWRARIFTKCCLLAVGRLTLTNASGATSTLGLHCSNLTVAFTRLERDKPPLVDTAMNYKHKAPTFVLPFFFLSSSRPSFLAISRAWCWYLGTVAR